MKNEGDDSGATFEETRARQLLLGLQMTPLERLRWLAERRSEMQRLSSAVSKLPVERQPKG